MAADAPSDPRHAWLQEWVSLKLGVRVDRYQKLLATPDEAAAVTSFLESADCMCIFFALKDKDLLASLTPPANCKKAVFFVKLARGAISAANIDATVAPGELTADILSQMFKLCQEVYLPIISNAENQAGWPDVVTREVLDNFQRLVAGIYVTIGQVQGKTLLPLPPVELSSADRASKDKERVHVLETAVVTWTRQIKNVLKTEPEQARPRMHARQPAACSPAACSQQPVTCVDSLHPVVRRHVSCSLHTACSPQPAGSTSQWQHCYAPAAATLPRGWQVLKSNKLHPGPLTELAFWTSKRSNLHSIQEQLSGEKIKKVMRVLELTKSTYFPAFSRLCKEVALACDEAEDNAKFLETLRATFEVLESKTQSGDAFAELPELFAPIMRRLLLVWKHSAHYNTPARLVVLVRETCNEVRE